MDTKKTPAHLLETLPLSASKPREWSGEVVIENGTIRDFQADGFTRAETRDILSLTNSERTMEVRRVRVIEIIMLVLACLGMTACGSRAPSGVVHGPGGIAVGEERAAVEQRNAKWTVEAEQAAPDQERMVQYRDYHWTWTNGWLHNAEHHVIWYTDGRVVKWAEGSAP